MNLHTPDLDRKPSRDEAEAALATLKLWAARASEDEIVALDPQAGALVGQGYPVLSRDYPADFRADAAYKDSLPDLQNGPASLIVGDRKVIQHVGISNFRLPIRYRTREGFGQDGGPVTLETSVTGTVSLEAEKKGINMSRIMRSFYAHAERDFSFQVIEHALDDYKRDLDSFDARIQMRFSFPMKVESLRSGLSGWQYYDIALELVDRAGQRKRILHLDFVYSSTCPCSLELSEHARRARGQLATPHSQRSVARISVEVRDGRCLWFEDLIDLARAAVPTETQVMVKREDEQAFAELNAANPIFVEDAARSFSAALRGDDRVGDFRIVASHQESLHSHDAVSVLTEGPTFAAESLDPRLFSSLYHVG
jgi:GTP cyclohydrolase I